MFAKSFLRKILPFSICVILTPYKKSDTLKFQREISHLRTNDRVLYWFAIKRLPSKWGRVRQAMPLTLAAAMTLQFIVYSQISDPVSNLHYFLGDWGLIFGPYRRIFNACVAIALSGVTFGMLSLFIIEETRGKITAAVRHPHPWEACWNIFLRDQSFLGNKNGLFMTLREKIKLWKIVYILRNFSFFSSCVFSSGIALFPIYSLITIIPFGNNFLLFGTTFLWICFSTPTLVFGPTFVDYGICMYSCQILFYLTQVKNLIRRLERRSKSLAPQNLDSIDALLDRWAALSKEFSEISWALNLINGFCIPGLLAVTLFWTYSANYFALTLAMRALTWSAAALGGGGAIIFFLNGSLMFRAQKKFPIILYRIIFHRLKMNIDRNLCLFTKIANLQSIKRCMGLIKNDTSRNTYGIKCVPFGIITFEHALMVFFEMVCYYLLVVATIGIPSQREIDAILGTQ